MSTKKVEIAKETEYDTVIVDEQTVTTVSVVWRDGDTVLVGGEKKFVGSASQAPAVAEKFADDLRRNFARRFPVIVPEAGEME